MSETDYIWSIIRHQSTTASEVFSIWLSEATALLWWCQTERDSKVVWTELYKHTLYQCCRDEVISQWWWRTWTM